MLLAENVCVAFDYVMTEKNLSFPYMPDHNYAFLGPFADLTKGAILPRITFMPNFRRDEDLHKDHVDLLTRKTSRNSTSTRKSKEQEVFVGSKKLEVGRKKQVRPIPVFPPVVESIFNPVCQMSGVTGGRWVNGEFQGGIKRDHWNAPPPFV